MEDTTVGLTVAAVLAVSAILKKKKAEAAPIEIKPVDDLKAPPLTAPSGIKATGIKASLLTAPSFVQPTGLETPPLTAPSGVKSISSVDGVEATSKTGTQALSIGVSQSMLQKLQELAEQKVAAPTAIPTPAPSPTALPVPTVKPVDKDLIQAPVEEVKIPLTEPVVADFGKPIIGLVDRSVLSSEAAMGGFFSKIGKELSRFETSVRKELGRTEQSVRKELSRAETSVRKELRRIETGVRKELGRFDRKIIRNLNPVKVIASIVGVILPPIGVAMMAMDAVTTYQEFAKAKSLAKRVEGAQAYANEVNSEITDIMSAPEKFAVTQEGGALGYLAKKRINSAFVPLVEINNPDFKDRFYVTIDMVPVLSAAKYQPSKIVGYISQIPFSGSTALKLMYSFELLEFVVATDGSRYMQELVSNGYTEVKPLGYVSMKPQEGPSTNRKLAEIEGV